MARSLSFKYSGVEFAFEIFKVDREKLYGDVSVETLNADGKKCVLASLARDGKTVIPYGGTASAYVNESGEWIDRDVLIPVDPDGKKLEEVPSTFDLTTNLDNEISIEEYLDYNIRLAYLMKPAEDIEPSFLKAIEAGKIFKIDFSYRGGSFADPAFVLAGEKGNIWLMIGEPGKVEYLSFEQAAICATNAQKEETEDDENDDFDFDML